MPAPLQAQVQTPAEYAVLMDAGTGQVLFEKNADALMAPASMSKLMTVAMVFEHLKRGALSLDDTFSVSEKAWKMGGSKMFVLVDTQIRVEDLLRGIIVQSGNDACVVVAEGISGTEAAFAEAMTKRAREIGLEKSTFANSTGWPHPNHKMTAYELALLARHIIREYPQYYRYFAEKEFTWSGITQANRNPLLFMDIDADGLKTGHTEESGYGLVASAVRGGQRLILAVNGLDSERARANEAKRLLDWGFQEFKTYALLKAGEVVEEANVWMGEFGRVPLVVPEDVSIIMRRKAREDMQVTVSYTGPIRAPVTAGERVGTVRVTAPGTRSVEVPLIAGADVARDGLWGRAMAALRYLIWGS